MACGGCAYRRDKLSGAARSLVSGDRRAAAQQAMQAARSLKQDAARNARLAMQRFRPDRRAR